MFFQKIYGSWKKIQMKKYEIVVKTLGIDFFKGKILDIGCGSLYFEEFLERSGIKANIVAADIDKRTLPQNRYAGIKVAAKIIASGNNIPFRSNSFDTIVSFDTMHLINKNDFRNVLKKNGFILFSIFFNQENFEEKRRMLKNKLAGFTTVKEFEIPGRENEYVVVARKVK